MNIDDHNDETMDDVRAGGGNGSFIAFHQHFRRSGRLERAYNRGAN